MAFNEAAYMPKSDEWQFKMHNSTMEFTVPWFGDKPLNEFLKNYTNSDYNTSTTYSLEIGRTISLGAAAGNENSTIKLNERLDRSIAYCAMDDNADFSKRFFYGNVNPLVIQECNSREDAQHPVAMFIHGRMSFSNEWINSNTKSTKQSNRPWGERVDNANITERTQAYKKTADDDNPDYEVTTKYYDTYFYTQSPVTSWDFKKVVFLINVVCGTVNPENYDYWNDYNTEKKVLNCDLYSYCNSKTEDGELIRDKYPYIHRISFSPAFGEYEVNPEDPNHPLKERESNKYGFAETTVHDNKPTGASFQPTLLSDCNGFSYTTGEPPVSNRAVVYGNPVRQSGTTFFYASKWDTEQHKDELDVTNIAFRLGCSLGCNGANDYFIETPSIRSSGDPTLYGIGIGWNKFHFKPVATSSSNATQNHILVWLDVKNDFDSIEAFREYCRKQAAYLGCFFTDDYRTAVRGTLTQSDMHLGIIDDNGVTHGEYVSGEDITKQKQWDWGDPIEDTPYDPNKPTPGDENEEPSDPYVYPENMPTGFNAFGTRYAMNQTRLNALRNYFNQLFSVAIDSGEQSEVIKNYDEFLATIDKNFMGETPISTVKSILAYPFNLDSYTNTTKNEYVHLGANELKGFMWFETPIAEVLGDRITDGDGIIHIPMGSYTYVRNFNDFRDFEPYSRAELSIPFHGTVDLTASVWIGHTISVEFIVDLATGSSIAIISRDGTPMISVTGNMAIQVPITGTDTTAFINQMFSSAIGYNTSRTQAISHGISIATNVLSGAAGVATNNMPMVVSSATSLASNAVNIASDIKNMKTAEFQADHISVSRLTIGSTTPSTSTALDTHCRIIRHYPKMIPNWDSTRYAHTIGYMCNISGTVGSFKGFTVFSNVNVNGITCTDQEKQMIIRACMNGIYL